MTVDDQLDALYAELPSMECAGLCHDSCGSIGMTVAEQRRIAARGVNLPLMAVFPDLCPALTMLKRCGVYPVRPLICRLWGLVRSMPCTHGCRPEGGYLTEAQGHAFLRRAMEIGDQAAPRPLRYRASR